MRERPEISIHVGFNGTDIASHLTSFAAARDFLDRAEKEVLKAMGMEEAESPKPKALPLPSSPALEKARRLISKRS